MWCWARKIFLIFYSAIPLLLAAQNLPERSSSLVTDYTGTLSSSEIQTLENKLVDFDRTSSSQVAVVIIKTLDGYDVAQYANELFQKWGIGGKKNNNGVLVLVAMDDRKMKIETGYGMEGALPDAIAKRIIENDMKPAFKNGNYFEGLNKATDNIIACTKGEYKADENTGEENSQFFVLFIVLGIILLVFIFRAREAQQYSRVNNIGFWAAWALLNALQNKPNGKWRDFSSGSGSFRGWSGGGGFGGGSSGGGFGGFGGGSSGGGGASGSW